MYNWFRFFFSLLLRRIPHGSRVPCARRRILVTRDTKKVLQFGRHVKHRHIEQKRKTRRKKKGNNIRETFNFKCQLLENFNSLRKEERCGREEIVKTPNTYDAFEHQTVNSTNGSHFYCYYYLSSSGISIFAVVVSTHSRNTIYDAMRPLNGCAPSSRTN